MSDTKWTSGRWVAAGMKMAEDDWEAMRPWGAMSIVRRGEDVICVIWDGDDRGEEHENAHLIAAAPDLYAALRGLLSAEKLDDDDAILIAARKSASAALRRARGET